MRQVNPYLTLTQRRTETASVRACSSRCTASMVDVGCSMEMSQWEHTDAKDTPTTAVAYPLLSCVVVSTIWGGDARGVPECWMESWRVEDLERERERDGGDTDGKKRKGDGNENGRERAREAERWLV